MKRYTLCASAILASLCVPTSAQAASDQDIQVLKAEIRAMQQNYQQQISQLQTKLATLEQKQQATIQLTASVAPVVAKAPSSANSFNPAIGLILNGRYNHFSRDNAQMEGFAVGEEGARGKDGLSLDESELNFSANVDDKFKGNLTASLVSEDGEDKVEIEEAFVQTLSGAGLPTGLSVKAGRALWTFGYLNEQHAHTDDFSDRPLPYRAFLNEAFNDDGAELSYVLPTDLYAEIGGGVFRGDDYPYGEAKGGGAGAHSAYARIGGDIGENQTWRVGASMLSGHTGERMGNEDNVAYRGDSDLYDAELRYTWAPTGNAQDQEVILQSEYLWHVEDGLYEDIGSGTGQVGFDGHSSGWYAQSVYKFLPEWRVGARYSRLNAPYVPAGLSGSVLDAGGYDPQSWTAMTDWTNSEFSRIRLQYSREELTRDLTDNQITLQYIMSMGAHGAHKY